MTAQSDPEQVTVEPFQLGDKGTYIMCPIRHFNTAGILYGIDEGKGVGGGADPAYTFYQEGYLVDGFLFTDLFVLLFLGSSLNDTIYLKTHPKQAQSI